MEVLKKTKTPPSCLIPQNYWAVLQSSGSGRFQKTAVQHRSMSEQFQKTAVRHR
ncbi:hypothetical protein [Fibrobacter sp. UWP2]|uniref:hypothetical protein n=1 Tax=Fibrobacter sp. UWP2 TaxID=1896216 RepID=UPI001356633D|nr:hypothetical protein [Fibrobacter sp. UWP2]